VGWDRALEELPDQDGLAELAGLGVGLSSPELATLQAHVKLDLKLSLLDSDLPDLPVFAERLTSYFPPALTARYPDAVAAHPLRREIVTTLMVQRDGSIAAGAPSRSGWPRRRVPGRPTRRGRSGWSPRCSSCPRLWSEIAGLPPEVPSAATDQLVLATRGLLDAGTRWFLNHRSGSVAEEACPVRPAGAAADSSAADVAAWAGRRTRVRREAAELVELGRAGGAGRPGGRAAVRGSACWTWWRSASWPTGDGPGCPSRRSPSCTTHCPSAAGRPPTTCEWYWSLSRPIPLTGS